MADEVLHGKMSFAEFSGKKRWLEEAVKFDPAILGRRPPTFPPGEVRPLPHIPPAPPTPTIPAAPANNPFAALPFRSPGDRIKADDFNKLSQSLTVLSDMYRISSAAFGISFGQLKPLLAVQQYEIQRVMTVFGNELENNADASLDNHKVVQVVPMVLGERRVAVVLTEAVETRRFAPNLLGLSYREASERLRAVLGEITFPTTPVNASGLVGLSLKDAKQALSK